MLSALPTSRTPSLWVRELVYRLTLVNDGPSEASNVVLTDSLPSEVIFRSASSGCGYVSGNITCGPVVLASGASVEYEITVIVERRPRGGKLENTAVVTTDQYDPDPSNDTVTEVTRTTTGGSGRG